MAEFCFDCWKKLFDENAQKEKYIISKYDDLCEGCGEYKPVIIVEKKYYYLRILKRLFFPVIFIFVIISIPFRLIYYPLLRYKLKKKRALLSKKKPAASPTSRTRKVQTQFPAS